MTDTNPPSATPPPDAPSPHPAAADPGHAADTGVPPAEYLGRERFPKPLRDTSPSALVLRERQVRIQEYQLKQLQVAHARERVQLGTQAVLGVGLAIVVLLLAWLVIDALRARAVVVNAWTSPPALQQKGLDGETVASGVFDALQAIQTDTHDAAVGAHLDGPWTNDVRLEAGGTLSFGGAVHALHRWLGHETYLSGNVVQSADGVTLTARGSGISAKSFSGKAEALPDLSRQAAEYLFGQAQPLLFAGYLVDHDRGDEVVAFAKAAFAKAPPQRQAALLGYWGEALLRTGDLDAAAQKFGQAIQLAPDDWSAYGALSELQMRQGREEAALQTTAGMETRRHRDATQVHPDDEDEYRAADLLRMNLGALKALPPPAVVETGHVDSARKPPSAAEVLARLHDGAAAERMLQTDPAIGSDPYATANAAYVRSWIALDRGDAATALKNASAMEEILRQSRPLERSFFAPLCWFGLVYGLGNDAAADAAFELGGSRVDCLRYRADVKDHRGDWAGAQSDYAAAVALAPSLPLAYQSWGEALLRHKDFAGAAAKFEAAHARGPRWADPLLRWGAALAAQNRFKEAVAKYTEAAPLAPAWGRVDLLWAQALAGQGDVAGARKKFQAALANPELDPVDRAVAVAALGAMN